MFMDKVIGVFTFRQGVYSEVEHDESFTNTAWMIVAATAFLGQLGGIGAVGFDEVGFVGWILGAIIGTLISVVGFAVAMWVIAAIGKSMFNAEVDFGELVRTLGLAYVWRAIGIIGIINVFMGTAITCLLAPLQLIAAVLGLVAMFMAAREALDLDGFQTAVTIVIGWIVMFVFTFMTGVILGIMGLAAAGAAGVFG